MTRTIGDTDLSALLALAREAIELARKATEAPWFDIYFGEEVCTPPTLHVSCTWPDYIGICQAENGLTATEEEKKDNMVFIAFSRNNIEALAQGVIELEKMLAEADEVIARNEEWALPEAVRLAPFYDAAIARHAARQKGNADD